MNIDRQGYASVLERIKSPQLYQLSYQPDGSISHREPSCVPAVYQESRPAHVLAALSAGKSAEATGILRGLLAARAVRP